MVANPAGFQIVFDYGAPRIISGYAREAVSGGWLVASSGAAAVVSSGANSFATADLSFHALASGTDFTGVAMHNAASGALVSVCIGGAVIATSAGTIVAGRQVGANGNHAIIETATAGRCIGRALTSAGSEGYCLFEIGRA
jgi:hypothetical protein